MIIILLRGTKLVVELNVILDLASYAKGEERLEGYSLSSWKPSTLINPIGLLPVCGMNNHASLNEQSHFFN